MCPGHLGYLPEDPQTLEEKFVATDSGRMESYSFVAPTAYLLELLMLWTDQSRLLTFGIAGVLGMLAGSAAMALATRTFRWEGFASVEDVAQPRRRRDPDGVRRRDGARLHDRAGADRISTLAVGSILTLRRDHRRLRRGGQVPDVANRACRDGGSGAQVDYGAPGQSTRPST